jgi:hypothetical protein
MHLALAAGWLLLRAWLAVVGRVAVLDKAVSYRTRVLVGRWVLLLSLAAWPLATLLPRAAVMPEATRFWQKTERLVAAKGPDIHAPKIAPAHPEPSRSVPWTALACASAFACELFLVARGAVRVRRVLRQTFRVRRHGSLDVRAQSVAAVPFALRLPRQALIVLPQELFAKPDELSMVLRHEGQHHRHHDTAWAWAFALAPLVFPLNPAVRLWRRTLQDLHEVACDEALVGRQSLGARAYGHCLLRIAEAAQPWAQVLPGTAGLSPHRQSLERRLVLLSRHERARLVRHEPRPLLLALTMVVALAAGLLSLSLAARAAKPHDPLTLAEAQTLVAGAKGQIPLEMNEAVLARLNKIITDPGRALAMREGLERMQEHRQLIEQRLKEEGMPRELLAVPLIESGYENLPPNSPQVKAPKGVIPGAGLWMFIKQTARRYGLKVTPKVDQRLDVKLETEAALRLLRDERLKYDDWLLSLAAYNQGGDTVDDAIRKGGTRDAWQLVQKGHLNDYLVYVTTGVILMDHPELLE